tara:strand:- start:3285 stop:4088 length:804 start_codon:yes stop_codon:yes gene_type:complete
VTRGYDLDVTASSVVACLGQYAARSKEVAQFSTARLNLPYGPDPRHKLDIFPVGPKDPVLVFIHGGYWKAGSKDTRQFPALEWSSRNVSWVCLNYRLLPHATIADAVDDVRNAVRWLVKNGVDHGIDPTQLHITGNSAGGHLAAMIAAEGWADRPAIKSLTAISGLFDLEPLLQTSARDWLSLTPPMAQELSPTNNPPPKGLPVLLGIGGAETDVFRYQMNRYGEACQQSGCPTQLFESPNADHFQIIGEYGRPDAPLFSRIASLIS